MTGRKPQGPPFRRLAEGARRRPVTRREPEVPFTQLPEDAVDVEHLGGDWWRVSIGRARGTKFFNLSHAEATALVPLLLERVLSRDGQP